jgi:hypothetical protein
MTTVAKRAPTTFDVVGGSTAPGFGGYYADDPPTIDGDAPRGVET